MNRKFQRMQWRMLIATMIGYTLFYFMRKNFSFAMPGLQQDCGISKSMLGNFLFWGGIVYGVSKFLNGVIGDKCRPKLMLCGGLLACTLINVAFGFVPEFAGKDMTALAWSFGILLVLNQFFQGTGFPPCAKLIAHWIPPNELATKMSVWNTSHSIGGGLVAKVCGVIMGLGAIGAANQGVGMWKWCFWSMAALGALGLVAMWLFLPGTPEEEGMAQSAICNTEEPSRQSPTNQPVNQSTNQPVNQSTNQPVNQSPTNQPVNQSTNQPINQSTSQPINQSANKPETMARMVFLNPVIWMLGLCNFTINAVRALVADWGPTMLQEAKGLSSGEAGSVIMWFEFAGIAGMLFAGWATDKLFGGRAPRLCVFLMALTGALLAAFWLLPPGGYTGFLGSAALCAAGFCLYGPQALTGVTATNTSTKAFAGTSIGFISLFSYVGVSVSGKVCGTLAQHGGGWQSPVLVIAGTSAVGCVLFLLLWNVRANSYGN